MRSSINSRVETRGGGGAKMLAARKCSKREHKSLKQLVNFFESVKYLRIRLMIFINSVAILFWWVSAPLYGF